MGLKHGSPVTAWYWYNGPVWVQSRAKLQDGGWFIASGPLKGFQLRSTAEGIDWCRGWKSEAADALRATVALL